MWFECASSIEDEAPTTEELDTFLEKAADDNDLVQQVYHRFVLTRGRRKFISWMKASFFFRNATDVQMNKFYHLIPWRM